MAPLPNVQPEVDGSLAYDGERLPLRLLTPGSGGVLGAGARLAPYLPNAPGLSGEVVVSGRNRTVEGQVTLSPTPGFVTLSLDSLDHPTRFTTRSTLRPLTWEASISRDDAIVATFEGRLRWASLDVTLTRRAQRLEVDVDLKPRGPWSPVVSALLLASTQGSDPTAEIAEMLASLADDISEIAGAPRLAEVELAGQLAEDVQLTDHGLSVMTNRLREVDRQVTARAWWQSKSRSVWRSAYGSLRPGRWPDTPTSLRRPWEAEEVRIAEAISRLHWRDRRDAIGTYVDELRGRLVSPGGTDVADLSRPSDDPVEPADRDWGDLAGITDADLDLAWLGSPRTVWRKMSADAAQVDPQSAS